MNKSGRVLESLAGEGGRLLEFGRRPASLRSRSIKFAGLALTVLGLLWVVQYGLRAAPTDSADRPPLSTPLDPSGSGAAIKDISDWRDQRAPALREAFQVKIYGRLPAPVLPELSARRLIDGAAFGGLGRIEETTLLIAGPTGHVSVDVALILPLLASGRAAPVVIVPNFCGNRAALGFQYPDVSQPRWIAPRCRTSAGRLTTELLHGENIIRLPVEDLVRAGFAVATFSPSEIVPDDALLAPAALDRLPAPGGAGPRAGAIGAWAWSVSRIVDAVTTDPRLDAERIAVFGHSRFGKAILLAAALDERIHAVIANQSGRLGASPSADREGEPLTALFDRFPHWFPHEARLSEAGSAAPDQQNLLALIAPRPLLLGGASLDRWSDPLGAFQSARAASSTYRLLGGSGLDQGSMMMTNLDADMAYYFRSGGHGIRHSDWKTAIEFLKRHLGASRARIGL